MFAVEAGGGREGGGRYCGVAESLGHASKMLQFENWSISNT